jgi:lysophospholipase L1-like esterase
MKSRIVLLLITLLALFALSEFALRRFLHIVRGVHTYSQWFNEVDTLVAYKGFYADSDGIFKTDPAVATYLNGRLDSFTYNTVPPSTVKNVSLEFYGLDRDYFEIQNPAYHNTFADYVRRLKISDTAQLDEVERAILYYTKHPLNTDGFRGIEFKQYVTAKKKILLLGDSFTWGHSTQNKTNSFADLLVAKGYVVYNTGISGADPAQYLAVAKKYVPLLKPDYVVVNFFMGNDIQYYKREVKPYMPIHYSCNASNLIACPNGIYFANQHQAYDFVKAHYHIPQRSWFDKACSLTATGTLLWKVMAKFNFHVSTIPVQYENYWKETERYKSDLPVCNNELQELERLCKASNAGFILIAMPELRGGRFINPDKVPHLFDSLPFSLPATITINDYDAGNGHYNEEGQRKHAEYIDGLIRK